MVGVQDRERAAARLGQRRTARQIGGTGGSSRGGQHDPIGSHERPDLQEFRGDFRAETEPLQGHPRSSHRSPSRPQSPLDLIEWALHRESAPIQDMGIDHRGRHTAVAEQLLNGADVVAAFQQVRREAVAQ